MKEADITRSFLPDPKQTWAHSTCSKEQLLAALDDINITAIEADIAMGRLLLDDSGLIRPIMAHPPDSTSDLSFDCFLELATKKRDGVSHKHLKLDFKRLETLEPCLNYLCTIMSRQDNSFDKMIFLNADILNGPGNRYRPLHIEADIFIEKCLQFTQTSSDENLGRYSLSLGWSVDCRSLSEYTPTDVDNMRKVIERNGVLTHFPGIVLAVNARILAKNPAPFLPILRDYPQIQLLAWTGTGEPPISNSLLTYITEYYQEMGYLDQIGFDCQVATSFAKGLFYDNAVRIVGLFWNIKQMIV